MPPIEKWFVKNRERRRETPRSALKKKMEDI